MPPRRRRRVVLACCRRFLPSDLLCQLCGTKYCLACKTRIGPHPERELCVSCAICHNCRRQQLDDQDSVHEAYKFTVKPYKNDRTTFTSSNGRKWVIQKIEKTETSIHLCGTCYEIAEHHESEVGNNPENAWPVFIWTLLMTERFCQRAWELIPNQWKRWWRTSVIAHWQQFMDDMSWIDCGSIFTDVTNEFASDANAVNGLKWVDLMSRETSLALPTIRCPAGCSEFKHRCNEMELDIVFEACLGEPLPYLFSKTCYRQMTRIFREDYCLRVPILYNPDWLCVPSIAVTEYPFPTVLSCRHHDHNSKHQMVHPPSHPTGPIASNFAGNLSPVVPVPRTIQKAKMSAYSASFHMAALNGCFQGIDTMYLSSAKDITSAHTALGWRQDIFSYIFRSDVRSYVKQQYAKYWHQEGCIAAALDREAKALAGTLKPLRAKHSKGATYVQLQDAVNLQHAIDFAGPETGLIKVTRGTVTTEESIRFSGPYPQFLIWNHPLDSKHGCVPPMLPRFKHLKSDIGDTRLAWLLCTAVLLVPELWHSIAKCDKKQAWSWEGHLLSYLTSKHLPHIVPKWTRGSPFKRNISLQNLLKKHILPASMTQSGYDAGQMYRMLHDRTPAFEDMLCLMTQLPPDKPDSSVKLMVVIRDYNTMQARDHQWTPPMIQEYEGDFRRWKLCYIAEALPLYGSDNAWNGVVYSRYSAANFDGWWYFERYKEYGLKHQGEIDLTEICHWDLCIYVPEDNFDIDLLKDSIVQCCGGQCTSYCDKHSYPLISALPEDERNCTIRCNPETPCSNRPLYVCSYEKCPIAICKEHHSELASDEKRVYVSDDGVRKAIERSHETVLRMDSFMEHGNDDDNDADNDDTDKNMELADDLGDDVEGINQSTLSPDLQELAFEDFFRSMDADTMDEYFGTGIAMETDDMDDIVPRDQADKAVADELFDGSIPFTNPAARPVFTYVEHGMYSNHTVSNYVFANKYGHCLIRRNKKLEPSLIQKRFFERLAARQPNDSLPLAFPEGMLFPHVYFLAAPTGSIAGAKPVGCYTDPRSNASFGFCPLEDDIRTHMSDCNLLNSTCVKLHFWGLDMNLNLGMRGCDSRIIISRGFAENRNKGGVVFKGKNEKLFDTESVDCRPQVNKLAAAVLEDPPTYFYTHTCSMKTHFGIAVIWKWLSGEAILQPFLKGHESVEQREELRKNLVDAAGVLLLRCWMEMILIWVAYITRSPEQPIGKVTKHFIRMELQEAKANLPHLHSLLWTAEDLKSEEGLKVALDRIRGFILDIVRPEEREQYIADGIFKNDEAYIRFQEMIQSFLTHKHDRRCYVAKRGATNELEFRCKANDNYQQSPNPAKHCFVEIPTKHTKATEEILQALGLGEINSLGVFKPTADCLRAVKHYPPSHGNEGIIQPVFGTLTARNPSMGNVQFATGYTLSRYLTKYIVAVEQYHTVDIGPPKNNMEQNTFTVAGRNLNNQKITSNRLTQSTQGKSTNRIERSRKARSFNVVEFYMNIFGYQTIMSNIDFIRIETRPYEDRASVTRKKPYDKIKSYYDDSRKNTPLQHQALTIIDFIPTHRARQELRLPLWRQFAATQLDMIYDDLQSPLSVTTVTIFGARCPELCFIRRQKEYVKWFVWTPLEKNFAKLIELTKNQTSHTVNKTMWIDGFNNHVRVRARAIEPILNELLTVHHGMFPGAFAMTALFQSLHSAVQASNPTEEQRRLLELFVEGNLSIRLPTIWFDSVRPTCTNRFLIHLLLSFGDMVDEYDMFCGRTIRDSFIKSGLLDIQQPRESAVALTKEWVLSQHASMPGGTPTWDRYLVVAYHTILDLFLHDQLFSDEVPTVLYCRTRDETEEKIAEFQRLKRKQLSEYCVKTLTDAGITPLPTSDECIDATITNPVPWDPETLVKPDSQPVESYNEQQRLIKLAKHLVEHYVSGQSQFTKGLCQVGAGGVGKTTLMLIEILHAMCSGLNGCITAMVGERAQELSGTHIHDMWGLRKSDNLSPGQMAEKSIATLHRTPAKLELLRSIDFLALDEAGACPSEMLSTMCSVLRYIRNNNRPFGGLLIFCTMDYLQLEPVQGRHPLLSPVFTSSFFFKELVHSVRAAGDLPFRQLQAITRLSADQLNDDTLGKRQEFIQLFVSTFRFIKDLDDPIIPKNAVFTFGKRTPIKEQENRVLKRIKRQRNIPFLIAEAKDEERTIDGNFRPATDHTSKQLDSKVKEPRHLVLYEKGRYQITYNKPNHFSSSQLAILFDMPSESDLERKAPIKLMVAPAGSRYIPDDTVTKQALANRGWSEHTVGVKPQSDVHILSGGIRGVRRQYGLRHHIGTTIHGIMGQTLTSLVTRVEPGGKNAKYALWLAAQVVVLLSRTREGKHTFFWLDAFSDVQTAEALYDALCLTTPFRMHIEKILKSLCGNSNSTEPYTIDHSTSIFRARDIPLPTDRSGYVYLICSTKDPKAIYIGSCYSLRHRWTRHNNGKAARQTESIYLRPWAVLAFIVGFNGNKPFFVSIEQEWIARKQQLMANNRQLCSVEAVHNLGKAIVAEYNAGAEFPALRFVSCGTFKRIRKRLHEQEP